MQTDTVNVLPPIRLDNHSVRFALKASGKMKDVIVDDFVCEYDIPLDDVPDQILVIPLLGSLLPIVWALNARLKIDVLDQTFYDAIPLIKSGLQNMYPDIEFLGHLECERTVQHDRVNNETDRSLMLFSGGVDSVASALRHADENLALASIWGIDISLTSDNAWDVSRQRVSHFADQMGLHKHFIKSNVRSYFDVRPLNTLFGTSGEHWYDLILGFNHITHTAPIAYAGGYSTVYIPASFTQEFQGRWGTAPSIDENIRWSQSRTIHDGYELTRMDKLNIILEKCVEQDLLVCSIQSDYSGKNCGRCEKCSRTIIGITALGGNPEKYGFPMSKFSFDDVRRSIENNHYHLDDRKVFFWRDIQDFSAARTYTESTTERFFTWLQTVDFDALGRRSDRKQILIRKILRIIGQYMPNRFRKTARRIYYAFAKEY